MIKFLKYLAVLTQLFDQVPKNYISIYIWPNTVRRSSLLIPMQSTLFLLICVGTYNKVPLNWGGLF